MTLAFPTIFLLPAHLQPEQLLDLEEKIPSLTYDIREAEIVLGRVSRPERAQFELRRAKLDTEPVEHHETEAADASGEPSPKRQRLITGGAVEGNCVPKDASTVKVLKLQWLTDSLEKDVVLPIDEYLVYEGTICAETGASVASRVSPKGKGILERAGVAAANMSPRSSRRNGVGRDSQQSQPLRPALLHESTSDHDATLPPIPAFLHTAYSCQRPTFVNPPNADFVEKLKQVRTLRLLQGDQIGVRAYSTSIATLAAYPFVLQNITG